jgi:hypothetical protein
VESERVSRERASRFVLSVSGPGKGACPVLGPVAQKLKVSPGNLPEMTYFLNLKFGRIRLYSPSEEPLDVLD